MAELLAPPKNPKDLEPRIITPEELFANSEIILAQEKIYNQLKRITYRYSGIIDGNDYSKLFNRVDSYLEKLLELWQKKWQIIAGSQNDINFRNNFCLHDPQDQDTRIIFSPKDHNDVYDYETASLSIHNNLYPPQGYCSLQLQFFDASIGITTGSLNFVEEGARIAYVMDSCRFDGKHTHTVNLEFNKNNDNGSMKMSIEGKEEFEYLQKESCPPKVCSSFELISIPKRFEY